MYAIIDAPEAYAATAEPMPLPHKLGAYFLLLSICVALVWALLGFRTPRDGAPMFSDPDKPINEKDFRR